MPRKSEITPEKNACLSTENLRDFADFVVPYPGLPSWAILAASLWDFADFVVPYPGLPSWAIFAASLWDFADFVVPYPGLPSWAILDCPYGTRTSLMLHEGRKRQVLGVFPLFPLSHCSFVPLFLCPIVPLSLPSRRGPIEDDFAGLAGDHGFESFGELGVIEAVGDDR